MFRKPTYKELKKNLITLKNAELDHQRIEEILRDEISRWRILIEQSRDGIVVLDQDGKVYEANKRFADMLGYTVDELNQLYVWDWDTQFSKEQLLKMLQTVDFSGAHFETQQRRKDGTIIDVELSNNGAVYSGQKLILCLCRDITDRKRDEKERIKLIKELQEALAEIRTLKGILPICSYCKKIRDDKGYWEQIEVYIRDHSEAEFTHGLCPECAKKLYPDYFNKNK
ncbi:MAG: PAS domain S-box protein [Spirochaetes bacterium]|nr:PAS domain S-box protein [Spirochaetota bacterium]